MPVLAEYRPTQAPGANVQNFLNAYDQTSSLMERKQRLQMAQEQSDQQKAEFFAKLPAIQANADLQVANARAAIKLSADNSIQEAEAAKAWSEPDGYNEEFQNIIQTIHDPKEQADALTSLQGKVAWTKQFKAYAPGVEAVNNARASAVTMALTNLKLDDHFQELIDSNQAKRDVAATNAGAKMANAQTYSGSREKIAAINADTKLGVEDKKAAKQGIQLADLQTRASQAEQDAADAERDGNPKLAQSYRVAAANFRDAIQHTTTFAGSSPSAPKPKTEDPTPSPKVHAENPPLTFMGKSLADPAAQGGAPITKIEAPARQAVQQAVTKPVKGTRAKQNGVWYQFDGSTWNAEKSK